MLIEGTREAALGRANDEIYPMTSRNDDELVTVVAGMWGPGYAIPAEPIISEAFPLPSDWLDRVLTGDD